MRYGGSVYTLLSQNADWNKNQYSSFHKEFIKVLQSSNNTSLDLSKAEFKDLYTIYAIYLLAQAIVIPSNQLTINVERRDVPFQNAETLQNPRKLNTFFVIILEAKIQINCINKVTRKI